MSKNMIFITFFYAKHCLQ